MLSQSRALRGFARYAFAACAGLLTWLGASLPASADTPRVHLALQRPVASVCPSGTVLESDLERVEGRKIFTSEAAADVLVEGRIDDLETGVYAEISARTADGVALGTRVLRAPAGECASLRRALGLVLLMLLELDDDPARVRAAPFERAVQFGVGGAVLSGTMPRMGAGVSLAFGVDLLPRLRLRSDGSYWLPVSVETPRGVGAKLQAYTLGLALCPRLSRASTAVALWFCGGGQLGGLTSSPRLLVGPAKQTRLLGQALLELTLAVRLYGASWLEASLGPVVSFNRPQFYYRRSDGKNADVFRPALLGAIFRLGFIIDGL